MTKQNFIDDLQKIYDYLDNEKAKTNELLKFLENKEFEKLKLIDDFAKDLDLKMSEDLRFALVTRLVNLRDDSLVQVLKKLEKTEKEIIDIAKKSYKNMAKMMVVTAYLKEVTDRDDTVIENEDIVDNEFAKGKGIIIASLQLGAL